MVFDQGLSTASKDKSTLGTSGYERSELDFYPTPDDVTKSILPYLPKDLNFWEPACGNGAISKFLVSLSFTYCSDIKKYPNTLSKIQDFLKDEPPFIKDVCIVTNPPYHLSREFVQRALDIPQVARAFFLLRHEWDAPAKSLPLVTHPSFKCKYVLKKRPRWIEGTTTAPRFPYAWYEWDKSFKGKPTVVYGI